jgi:hypothetical protein
LLGEGDEGASLELIAKRTQQFFLPAHTAVRSWFPEEVLGAEEVAERKQRSMQAAGAILSRTLDLLTRAGMGGADALVSRFVDSKDEVRSR